MIKLSKFPLNEYAVAEKIVETGFPDGIIDNQSMYYVAKYLRETMGYGKVRLKDGLIRYCKKHDAHFNPITWDGQLDKWVTSAMKYNLRVVESVKISKKELSILSNVENEKDRKILFIMLVFSKAMKKSNVRINNKRNPSQKYYLKFSNFIEIAKLSEIPKFTRNDVLKVIYDYKDLFEFYDEEKELIRLDFIDLNPTEEFTIYDLDNTLLDSYQIFFGSNISSCKMCNAVFSKNSNRQMYCPSCSRKRRANRVRKAHVQGN